MKFQEQIDHDLKEAMKARAAEKLAVLRMLKSALTNAAIEKGGLCGTVLEDNAMALLAFSGQAGGSSGMIQWWLRKGSGRPAGAGGC